RGGRGSWSRVLQMKAPSFPCWTVVFASLPVLLAAQAGAAFSSPVRLSFSISFPESVSQVPLDGRVLFLVSNNDAKEPRFQISEDLGTQQVFGIDVEGLKPGQAASINATAFGYPLRNLAQVPAGEYWVQALFHRYETVHRADGHTLKVPMDRGE